MKRLTICLAASLSLAISAVHAQEQMSWELRGAIARVNSAAGKKLFSSWVPAFRGSTNIRAAFDTKNDTVLRPSYSSGTHADRSIIYMGMNRRGELVGGITPFGEESCSADAIGRPLALRAYFGTELQQIELRPLERLTYTLEGSAPDTLCYYPFTLTPAQMDRYFQGLSDDDAMRFSIRIDDKVNHSAWTGPAFTEFDRGSSKNPQRLSLAQYRALRDAAALMQDYRKQES